MEKITNIKDNIRIKEIKEKERTIISVIQDDKETLLSDMKTDEYFWNKWVNDDNYIVAYSRGCMVNQIPFNIEAAYSIESHQLLDLSTESKTLLEYMLISKRCFSLASVLSAINSDDLGLLYEEEQDKLRNFLTSGNKNISHENMVDYILKIYPQLTRFTNLKGKLSLAEYGSIENALKETSFWFHAMPQKLSFLQLDGEEPTLNKDNEQQRFLKLKKLNIKWKERCY